MEHVCDPAVHRWGRVPIGSKAVPRRAARRHPLRRRPLRRSGPGAIRAPRRRHAGGCGGADAGGGAGGRVRDRQHILVAIGECGGGAASMRVCVVSSERMNHKSACVVSAKHHAREMYIAVLNRKRKFGMY